MTTSGESHKEPIPEKYAGACEGYRTALIEAVSDFDDEILEMYLEGEKVPRDKLVAAMKGYGKRQYDTRNMRNII